MEIKKIKASEPIERIYIAAAELPNFRGKHHVEVQLFRSGITPEEIEACSGLDLVGPAPNDMPPEILKGATKEAALECALEAFTEEEAEQLCSYLQERYANQISKLTICPMTLPVPLGIGPLGKIPETATAGFINFDQAPGYALPFSFRGYYDLGEV